ncbi:MAG: hypothetical protein ACI3U8_08650 [Candidatus Onthomonas sp.]
MEINIFWSRAPEYHGESGRPLCPFLFIIPENTASVKRKLGKLGGNFMRKVADLGDSTRSGVSTLIPLTEGRTELWITFLFTALPPYCKMVTEVWADDRHDDQAGGTGYEMEKLAGGIAGFGNAAGADRLRRWGAV